MTDSAVTELSLFRRMGLPYFLIAFIARLPFAMMIVGVLTMVVSVRGSMALAGVVTAVVGLGTALVGPLLGAAADRFGQRRVLVAAALFHSAALLTFTWVVGLDVPNYLVLSVALLIGASAPQVAPMSRARLMMVIQEKISPDRAQHTLSGAMAYEGVADEAVFIFGPFVVGVLASFLHPAAPLIGAAALTALFVGAFALHPSGREISQSRDSHGHVGSKATELFQPRILIVVIGIVGIGMFFGSMLTSLTAFMDVFEQPERAGLLYGVMGITSAIFALASAWFPDRFTLNARWLASGAVLLVGAALLPGVTTQTGMMLVLALLGVGVGPMMVTQFSLGAERAPLGRSATVMTMLGSGVIVGQSVSAAVTGLLAARDGAFAALWVPVVAITIVILAGIGNSIIMRQERLRRIRIAV